MLSYTNSFYKTSIKNRDWYAEWDFSTVDECHHLYTGYIR